MSNNTPGLENLSSLIPHIFLPVKLPQAAQEANDEQATSRLLCEVLKQSAEAFKALVPEDQRAQWNTIIRMLDNVQDFVNVAMSPTSLSISLDNMRVTDVLTLHIRAQNAAVVVRKRDEETIFEVFEASPPNEVVYSTPGKLLIDYPGPAISVPVNVCSTQGFRDNLALFLSSMDVDALDATPKTSKAGAEVDEVRNTADPKYISQLLVGILHGVPGSSNPDARRVTKHVADEVMWSNAFKPWRRLPLWLILRVSIQTTLATKTHYKAFILFFMARTLSLCIRDERTERSYSSDLLFNIRSKVARRFAKLGDATPNFVQTAVTAVGDRIQAILEQRWTSVQAAQSQSAPWNPPSSEQMRRDTWLSLTTSLPYLERALEDDGHAGQQLPFSPSHPKRFLGTTDFEVFANGRLTSAVTEDSPYLVLADFEGCVLLSLDDWSTRIPSDKTTYGKTSREHASQTLLSCFDQYRESTARHYKSGHPEDQSIAALTLLALWRALDRVAIKEHPLLKSFRPEIPEDLLEPLVLRDQSNVQLARDIEVYIRGRYTRASAGAISLFETSSQRSSFALRTFHERQELQRLKSEIEDRATRERQQKRQELRRLNDTYRDLKRQSAALDCTYVTRVGYWGGRRQEWEEHSGSCQRCQLIAEAERLQIKVHEWPLPSGDGAAEMVVFELACPPVYSRWRDLTYRVLTSVGRLGSSQDKASPYKTLDAYDALSASYTARSSPFKLASDAKPFVVCHYRETKIKGNTPESEVCVNNGLIPYLYHSTQHVRLSSTPLSTCSLVHLCSPALDSRSPYRVLQQTIDFTTHTSNEVLADQVSCAKELSLHEYITFASMRSGGRLQWLNILRELRARTLTFSAPEVYHLITQTIWQLGPLAPGQMHRDWHMQLEDHPFSASVMREALALLQSVGENWKETGTVHIIVAIVLRVLDASPHDAVQEEARAVLREARRLAALFRDNLHERLRSVPEVGLAAAQRLVCEAAAVCAMTFDVPSAHLSTLLDSPNDVYEVVRSLILVQENHPSQLASAPLHIQLLLCRHNRVARRVESNLRTRVLDFPEGMHRALHSLWSGYSSDGPWLTLNVPNERQITRTLGTGHIAHFNILTGLLLVNGRPLGRLPSNMTAHPVFRRLLGQAILDVIPAADPYMEYETRASVSGWTLAFAMRANSRLIIRAHLESNRLEFIPPETFRGDVPDLLVDDCAHWLDLDTGDVEFRPLDSRWTRDGSNWRLTGVQHHHRILMRRLGTSPEQKLVDPRSATFRTLHSCLGLLERSGFICLSLREDILSAELPRFRLSFFVNILGQLQISNFKDMIVDEDQSSGTFFGLRNQLVLRAKDPDDRTLPRSRRVLVPDGQLSYGLSGSHVTASIQISGSPRLIAYHVFVIDNDLRCLSTSSGTTSLLFQCLLHAVTSSRLPDPLTGRTGTEQALINLSSTRLKSLTHLSDQDLFLLHDIASLSPLRAFYPPHLTVMQQVNWCNLPPLSQHAGFKTAADLLLSMARDLELFRERARDETTRDWSIADVERDGRLIERSLRRSGVLYCPDISDTVTMWCKQPGLCARRARCICSDRPLHLAARHSPNSPAHVEVESSIAELSRELQAGTSDMKSTYFDILAMLEKYQNVGGERDLTLSYSSLWLSPEVLGANWFALYDQYIHYVDSPGLGSRMQVLFSLCSLAFTRPDLRPTAKAILAMCLNDRLRAEPIPVHTPLDLSRGYRPTWETIETLRSGKDRAWRNTPAGSLSSEPGESRSAYQNRQHQYYGQRLQSARTRLVTTILAYWPRTDVRNLMTDDIDDWINVRPVLEGAQIYFESCSRNLAFADHIRRVQALLRVGARVFPNSIAPLPDLHPRSASSITAHDNITDSLLSLFTKRQSSLPIELVPIGPEVALPDQARCHETHGDASNVNALLDSLTSSSASKGILKAYLEGLRDSVQSLTAPSSMTSSRSSDVPTVPALRVERDVRAARMRSAFGQLCLALLPISAAEQQLHASGLWPRVTEPILLSTMSFSQRSLVPEAWMRCLLSYGQLMLAYQRAQRLLEHNLCGRREELVKELQNTTLEDDSLTVHHDGIEADWTLVQIENSFLARPVQRAVARQMISPSPLENSLQQLNMGEGKSSVIVPFIVTALARGAKLVRVVVLKALSNQMFNLLVDRLSGLAGRRVLCLPFSRGVDLSQNLLRKMEALYKECARTGGVLVMQPEHALSFKLMALDYLTGGARVNGVAPLLWDLQQWVDSHTRDVLDESDELLHARYQLIYTVGLQQPMDNHPFRWTIIQQVLLVLKRCLEVMAANHPHDILFGAQPPGQFPYIRLLTANVDEELTMGVVNRVMSGHIPDLHFSALPAETRNAITRFIGSHDLSDDTRVLVKDQLSEGDWKGVLLLRGLLALGTGVLLYVLKQRRWRVDFGLDPTRSQLAVPYRAKDVPSLKAEFGHPDVAITLTCISYYYGGLTEQQVSQCFTLLLKMDDPQREYAEWVDVGGRDVPSTIRQLSGVNLDDRGLVEAVLVPTFSYNYAVINFFLSHAVFPREAKEFPHKLGTSAWDLAERKPNVTTGFSGTKDNRFLLPTSISQKDLPEQRGTDALVLSHMLQPENSYAAYTGTRSGEGYLQFIVSQKPVIRVVLDVGAQMLDLKNEAFARVWLELCDESVQAAIFFKDDDLAVVTRDGVVERLRSSSFSEQLDRCIIYLDDVHTRGTDLKLPKDYRAALTVGQKVTKDRLVQGAMRMRKLGYGQSVMILAPEDIDRAIRRAAGLDTFAIVQVRHVLQWAMLETCEDISQHIPHWAEQGVDYQRRLQGVNSYIATSDTDILRDTWMRQEARTLDEMYGTTTSAHENHELWESVQKHTDIMARLSTMGINSIGSARLSEEQEREVVLEVERERQVERPPKAQPARHHLHQDVLEFVRTGAIPASSTQFVNLFTPLNRDGDAWDPRLLATRDFSAVLDAHHSLSGLHEYLRPLAWVLSQGVDGPSAHIRLVVISPFEANQLLPILRTNASGVRLHIFTPRLVRSMPSVSNLRLYSIPALPSGNWSVPTELQLHLSLIAGGLWMDDHASYKLLCKFLGLYMGYADTEIDRLRDGAHIASDGFVRPGGRALVADPSQFRESPVERLRELIGLRRKGVAAPSTCLCRMLAIASYFERDKLCCILTDSVDFVCLYAQIVPVLYSSP
ncbi:unnamed protein product [Peniophora sp. CBMAI 1063]|nr:unnamed protein product [Peniophora sp. CBMAI 1063]